MTRYRARYVEVEVTGGRRPTIFDVEATLPDGEVVAIDGRAFEDLYVPVFETTAELSEDLS